MTPTVIEENEVSIRGCRIFYRVTGEGPGLILLHGMAASGVFWKKNLLPLGESHRVFAPDLPGFGRSGKPKLPYRIDLYVAFLTEFMAAMNLHKASLIGHSMGGWITALCAARFPERVERLVLVDSAGIPPRRTPFSFKTLRMWGLGELLMLLRTKAQIRFVLGRDCFVNPFLVEEDLVEAVALSSRQAILAVIRSSTRLDIRSHLPAIQAPTLIIWGEQDMIVPVPDAYIFHELVKGSQLRIITGAGHCPQIEKAEEVNDEIKKFLQRETSS